jgi:hypothetical protein
MSTSFGSGQTSGLPLLLTTGLTQATAETLHTAVGGAATPEKIKIFAINQDTVVHTVGVEIAIGATKRTFTQVLGLEAGLQPLLEDGDRELVLNGGATVKIWTDTASKVSVVAQVDNQADAAGTSSQALFSGLIASVQNASRFGAGTGVGGVGTATEANAQILIPKAGTLSGLAAAASAAVGGGATVTVSVRINGVNTALLLTFANADGTTLKTDTDSVAVAAGDLVTFGVVCDNAGAPAADFQAACQYIC